MKLLTMMSVLTLGSSIALSSETEDLQKKLQPIVWFSCNDTMPVIDNHLEFFGFIMNNGYFRKFSLSTRGDEVIIQRGKKSLVLGTFDVEKTIYNCSRKGVGGMSLQVKLDRDIELIETKRKLSRSCSTVSHYTISMKNTRYERIEYSLQARGSDSFKIKTKYLKVWSSKEMCEKMNSMPTTYGSKFILK